MEREGRRKAASLRTFIKCLTRLNVLRRENDREREREGGSAEKDVKNVKYLTT